MILTFAELGIDSKQFNGMTPREAFAEVVNVTANKVQQFQRHPLTQLETLYDWTKTQIDFINHTVKLIANPWQQWMLINS